jgi:O-antigen ligase
VLPPSLTRPAEAGSSVARAAPIAAAAAVVALTVAYPSTSRMLTWPWVLLSAAVWCLPVFFLLVRLAGARGLRLPSALVTWGLASLAVVVVASAALSPFSAASLARVWPTLGGVALCLLVHDSLVAGRLAQRSLANLVALTGAVVAVASVVAWLNATAGAPWTLRNAFPFGHSNYTAGCCVLLLPWFVERAWSTRAMARVSWLLVVAITLFAVAGTSSRGAVAALVLVAAIAIACLVIRAPWSTGRKVALLAGAAVILFAASLANPRLRELALRRDWGASAQESNRQRSAMLDAGWRLGLQRPAFGWGPGTIPLAYPRVRAELDGGVDDVLELHNTPLQVWATLGLAGTLAGAVLLVGLARQVRFVRARPVALAAAFSLGGYAVFSLTEHQLDIPAMTALVAVNIATLTAATAGMTFSPSRQRTILAVVALVGCCAPALALFQDLRARHRYDVALASLESGHAVEALAELDAATHLAPHDPYFQHQAVGLVLGLRDATTDAGRRAALTRDAIARLEQSLRTGVHLEYAHFNLGWLELDVGNGQAATRHFVAAAHLVPDKGGVYFGLGLALQAAGRPTDAIRAFALEWMNDPRSATSPAWEVPALAAVRGAVCDEAVRLLGDIGRTGGHEDSDAAWLKWWQGADVRPNELSPVFAADSRDFIAALPALASRADVVAPASWARLYGAWRRGAFPVPGVARDAAMAAALARRAERHRDDFVAFLRAGSEDEAALVRTYRRARTGYGVLALHPDGPVLADVYIVQENVVITDFAAGLFPPKGWLPGRFLLAFLPANP